MYAYIIEKFLRESYNVPLVHLTPFPPRIEKPRQWEKTNPSYITQCPLGTQLKNATGTLYLYPRKVARQKTENNK